MESFLIAEKYVPTVELLSVAKAILLAQDIREESWNGKKYNKTNIDSVKEAVTSIGCNKFWITVIHGWNVFEWNDVQAWAQDIIVQSK